MEIGYKSLLVQLQRQPSTLREAILKLAQAIYAFQPLLFIPTPPRALLVGGFVRDLLLGLSSMDADMEIYGVEALDLEKILNSLFPEKVNAVGRAFGVFKIALGEGYELDVALPRRESKTGLGHKDFEIQGDITLIPQEAARRRDFTINAIMFDPLTGEILDPWQGIHDVEYGILRVVDAYHFNEDPLRVYRAIQFTARFRLRVEDSTFHVLQEMVKQGELDHLPPERVTEEWRKLLLKADKPSIGLTLMRELGIIEKSYPELQALIGVDQDPEWHPEGDVWIHTCMSVDAAAHIIRRESFEMKEKLQVMLGALCHDLGKASTTKLAPKQGVMRIRSLGHEEAGVAPTQQFLKHFCFGSEIEHAAIMAAKEHLKPGTLFRAAEKETWSEDQYANTVRKLLKRIYPLSWRVLVAISEADFRGRTLPESSAPGYRDGEKLTETVKNHSLDQAPLQPLLRGEDLMEVGIPPGPDMGRLIHKVEEARDRGEVKTKEEALELLEKHSSLF